MSVSPGRQSLAPTGAEDDGDSGTKSVPAMLRLVKDCLVRHTTCVNDAVSAALFKKSVFSFNPLFTLFTLFTGLYIYKILWFSSGAPILLGRARRE